MHPVEKYLNDLREIRSTGGGTKEESYYGALESFLNEIGRKFSPPVRCIPQLKNTGAGEPDFGLFAANQFQRSRDDNPIEGQLPERGVIECKPWNDDSFARTHDAQISKYLNKYGLVLITNYHDFVLIGHDDQGRPARLGTYHMTETHEQFHRLLKNPHKAADEQGNRLIDFLCHVMLQNAPIINPEDLAWFLASYAREARYRVESAAALPALSGLKSALEEALGMRFEGEKGDHFFQATLVQTLFYGIFSSWVLWAREESTSGQRFDWCKAAWSLHVPMIRSLFEQIAMPSKLKPLGVSEVLDWAGMALNRVDRNAFFQRFEEENAVQYFYEPFLKAYDPQLRKDLGVWFTPPEIVHYQVERVDRVLRDELGINDGLANDKVVILDPCCGTGAYLVATLKRIHKTLTDKGMSALTSQKVKRAALGRVFGFEILPAPFVVSHLQIGLMLQSLGTPFNEETSERASVFLTNALTGWEPLKKPKDKLPLFPELMAERNAANQVKIEKPIIVVLGNPPYNGFAGVSPEEEGGLVEIYKEKLGVPVEKGGWGIKKSSLDDLYVRFFRIAERRIAETGKGVISYISNFSYLEEPSFVVMRKHLLEEFDKIWIDCMNGDSRETGKVTPDGKSDPSVFSTDQNREGIKVGTAICIMVRKEDQGEKKPRVRFQDYWGASKRTDLLDSLRLKDIDRKYRSATPKEINRFSLIPMKVSEDYFKWPSVLELAATQPLNGPIERRGNSLIVMPDEVSHLDLLARYLDPNVSDSEIIEQSPNWMRSSGEFDAKQTRGFLKGNVSYDRSYIVDYPFKPFDMRVAYLDDKIAPLFSRPAPRLIYQSGVKDNAFFITRDSADKFREGPPFLFSRLICDYDCISGHARHFPILIKREIKKTKNDDTEDLFGFEGLDTKVNLSDFSKNYLSKLGFVNPDDINVALTIWLHALAIGYSPAYLSENIDGIRQNWPRIPLPSKKAILLKSAKQGERIAVLINPETNITIPDELKNIAVLSRVGGGAVDPNADELDLTAGWGHAGSDGVCMPGSGKCIEKEQTDKKLKRVFGAQTLDVYLNEIAYWKNIPRAVWDYYIGGYQVIKKWLSYREKKLIGRGLKVDEVEHVTAIARHIAALVLLQPELDRNYNTVLSDIWPVA